MIRKDNLPGVCAAMLVGIAAYSNLLSIDVMAAESQDAKIVNDEKDASDDITETDYKGNEIEEAVKVPDGVLPSEDGTQYSKTVDGDVETTYIKNTYEWVDEDGVIYNKVVEITVTDEKDSETVNVIDKGSSETITYPEGEQPLDHVEEDGTKVYIESETVTTLPTIETVTNENITTETKVTVTITKPVEDETERIQDTDDNGNLLYTDADGNITTDAFSTVVTDKYEVESTEDDYDRMEVIEGSSSTTSIYDGDEDLAHIKELLGDYGITSNKASIIEAETNINTGYLYSSSGQTGSDNKIYIGSTGDGSEMRFESIADDVSLRMKGNTDKVILGNEDDATKITWEDPTKTNYTTTQKEGCTTPVADTINEIANSANTLLNKTNADDTSVTVDTYRNDHAKSELDFTGVKNDSSQKFDVVYSNLSVSVYGGNYAILNGFDQTESMYIYMNSNQVVVLNINTDGLDENTEINLKKFVAYIMDENGNSTRVGSDNADGLQVTQQIVFNFGSFNGTIKNGGNSIMGTIIAPFATFINDATSAGQIVCDDYINGSGEWHYTGTSVKKETSENEVKYYKTIEVTSEIANDPLMKEIEKAPEVIVLEYDPIIKTTEDKSVVTGGDKNITYTYNNVSEVKPSTPNKVPSIVNPEENGDSDEADTTVTTPEENGDNDEADTTVTTPEENGDNDEADNSSNDTSEDITYVAAPMLHGDTDDIVVIDDDTVALASTIAIDDELVPLAPKTGDSSYMEMLTSLFAAFGSVVAGIYAFLNLKKK